MALISCRELTLSYEGRPVIQNLSFDLEAGQYLCILGENGAGKSTLLHALLGLRRPDAGTVTRDEAALHEGIGYLPQQRSIQRDFPASVSEVVLSGCLRGSALRPFCTRAEKRLARENMEKLGVASLAKRCYRELSGGQQQRVLLARALCAAHTLLFLDEPVAGLDPVVTAGFYRLIEQLHREGMTVVMVTHDIPAALRYATHILRLRHLDAFWGTRDAYEEYAGGDDHV